MDNVDAFRVQMLPSTTELRLDNTYAIFGDYYLDESEILINCGFNSSAGCPGDTIDQALLGHHAGVRDTVLPPSMFKETHRQKIRVSL